LSYKHLAFYQELNKFNVLTTVSTLGKNTQPTPPSYGFNCFAMHRKIKPWIQLPGVKRLYPRQ
jgi:hypothetical protein